MPAKTQRQANFMRMCASREGRKHANKECPPVSVAKEFSHTGHARKVLTGR